MRSPRPVLLVHGAWHGAWCFAALQHELDRRGVPSYAVDLPGRGLSEETFGDLDGDARRVRAAIGALGDEVVLVGHSYGGAVVSSAASAGHVSSVAYLAAFALHAGESVNDIIRTVPAPTPRIRDAIVVRDDGTSVLDRELAVESLYARCDPRAARAAVARLGAHPMATFADAASWSPIGRLPTAYVLCSLDAAIPVEQQDVMAARCDRTVVIETDHSPFLSATVEVADLLAELASAEAAA